MTSGGDWLPVQAPFDLVRRGFSPEQVTAHLERLEYDLRIATANRDATNQRIAELSGQLSAAQAESDAMRAQLDRNALQPLSMGSLSDRMQRMVRLSEEEAAEIRSSAEADAARLHEESQLAAATLGQDTRRESDALRASTDAEVAKLRDVAQRETDALRNKTDNEMAAAKQTFEDAAAEQWAAFVLDRDGLVAERRDFVTERDRLRAKLVADIRTLVGEASAEAERIRRSAEQDAMTRVSTATAESERLLTEAHQTAESLVTDARTSAMQLTETTVAEVAKLDSESVARRQQVEEDFEITIAARRTEAHIMMAERERTSIEEAKRRVVDATERSTSQLGQASAEANRLVQQAQQDAHRRVAEADAAVVELTDLRGRLISQMRDLYAHLGQVGQLIKSAPAVVAATPEEQSRVSVADFPEQVPQPAGVNGRRVPLLAADQASASDSSSESTVVLSAATVEEISRYHG